MHRQASDFLQSKRMMVFVIKSLFCQLIMDARTMPIARVCGVRRAGGMLKDLETQQAVVALSTQYLGFSWTESTRLNSQTCHLSMFHHGVPFLA